MKTAPTDYWKYHHPNCGTKYRGCDTELCPASVYESTEKWIGPDGGEKSITISLNWNQHSSNMSIAKTGFGSFLIEESKSKWHSFVVVDDDYNKLVKLGETESEAEAKESCLDALANLIKSKLK